MKYLFCLWLSLSLAVSAVTQWEPGRTYVLVASITEWPAAAGLSPFSGSRRDADLVKQFKAAGVPSGNIIFLKDSQATHSGICKALVELAERTTPADTLLFYFQGHGGQKRLYCYDYDQKRPDQTVLAMDEIYPLLSSWKGGRLFLIGDCCCSGSLNSVLEQFEKGRPQVRVATLASAMASNISTSNWTFTEGLIRILAGDPLVDANHDGQISLSEADRFLHEQMKYKEDQLASSARSSNFEKDFALRASLNSVKHLPGPYEIGDLLEAQDRENQWYTAEILDGKPGTYKVHYNAWDDKWDEWVTAARLRPIVRPRLQVGQRYEVLWQGNWLPAVVTEAVDDYFYFVHYVNEAGEDDEWITAERARVPGRERARSEYKAVGFITPVSGDMVAAQRKKGWYRAQVTGIFNGSYAVVYADNTTGQLSAAGLISLAKPEALRMGDRVLASWGGDGQMHPGQVQGLGAQRATIRWEDGRPTCEVRLDQIARIRR